MIDINRIRRGIADVRARGWTIKRDVTVDPLRKSCCAIGAVAVSEEYEGYCTSGALQIGEDILDMDVDEVAAFIDGFDNYHGSEYVETSAYVTGQLLAAEYT